MAWPRFYLAVVGAIFFWKFGGDGDFGNLRSVGNVARLLGDRVRPSDLVCRLGGGEFCVLLADSTLDDARHVGR